MTGPPAAEAGGPGAPPKHAAPLKVANCSGFFGDRLSAAQEMVDGGPIDVLSGDWLAELTMLILAKQRRRDPQLGYARTFLRQMEEVLGTCVERGIKVVSNAGGLNPAGCAAALEALGRRLGLEVAVATVTGDDLVGSLGQLQAAGERLEHLDTGMALEQAGVEPVTANAYIGFRGIAEALRRGADVVVTGRVADAALVVGPAAWRFGWAPDDWDALAGAVVAGHVIECGAQATGGNFSFFEEVPGLAHCGFPLAEVSSDGSAVITKHPGTGGMVTVETVTAQLLYEIEGARYPTPDVVARLDTVSLFQQGPDRVAISGTRGEPAPERLKVGINYLGGYRNSVTFVLTGLDVAEKAQAVQEALWASVPGGKESFDEVAVEQTGGVDRRGAASHGPVQLRVTVLDPDPQVVGRRFSDAAIQLTLANYPGFFTTAPPTPASEYGVFWPTLVDRHWVRQVVTMGHEPLELTEDWYQSSPWPPDGPAPPPEPTVAGPRAPDDASPGPPPDVTRGGAGTLTVPLGRLCGARSGDKGGNANVGVWARTPATYRWLQRSLTAEALHDLVPDTAGHQVTCHELPNLSACNFVITGLLGRGVAASTRWDPQAKGLGEELRAALVSVPATLVRQDPSPPSRL